MTYTFRFESLHAYQHAETLFEKACAIEFPRGKAYLRDQLERAASSVVLNIAEGHSKSLAQRRAHYSHALGSTGEVFAILRLIQWQNTDLEQELSRRIGLLLHRLLGR
jgi:four helix bundle protein